LLIKADNQSMSHTPGTDAADYRNLHLLIQLRWIAVFGQLGAISVATIGFGIDLPVLNLVVVVAALTVFNAASHWRWLRRQAGNPRELFFSLLIDVVSLSALLHLSGGVSNPFAFLYLLHVTLGAVLLNVAFAWVLVAATSICLLLLAVFSEPLAFLHQDQRLFFSMYVEGLLLCFVLNAALVVIAITRISRNLRERDEKLAGLRQLKAEQAHIVRMGLLASGAAHELGTPLATLSIILGDWRRMPELRANIERKEEFEDMQEQLTRCKDIVSGILLSAGEARAESSVRTTLGTYFDNMVEDWRNGRKVLSLAYHNRIERDLPVVVDSVLKQMVFNILDNALEASPDWVGVTVRTDKAQLQITIEDEGPGFPAQMLESIGEPYQSTKRRPGRGLGLFLSVNVARSLGGFLSAQNRQGKGASVRIELPLSVIAIDRDPYNGN
jgi:two-component system sensor histidine kinase RegB